MAALDSSGRHRQISFPELASERRSLYWRTQRQRMLVQYTILQRDRWCVIRLSPRLAIRCG